MQINYVIQYSDIISYHKLNALYYTMYSIQNNFQVSKYLTYIVKLLIKQ